MSDLNSIKGSAICTRILFEKGDFMIAKFTAKDKNTDTLPKSDFSLKGNMAVTVNRTYYVEGDVDTGTSYKNSYDAVSVRGDYNLSSGSNEDIMAFLTTFTTETRASNMIEAIGRDNIVKVLESQDIDTLTEVKGIGFATAEKIVNGYLLEKDYSEAYVKLSKFGLTKKAIRQICIGFKSIDVAIKKVEDNPYVLMEISGFGFTKADNAFLSFPENKPTDKRRVVAYIKYLFQSIEDEGHTWLDARQFVAKIKSFIPDADLKYAVEHVKESKDYIVEPYGEGGFRITSSELYELENQIANELERIQNADCTMKLDKYMDSIRLTEKQNGWNYNEEQYEAIDGMVNNNVFMLQGLGGTGKAQPVDTIIPTPNGDVRMGDIKVGDYVFDRLGKPTKVLGVFPQGKIDAYEVELADGRKTICNDEHLWTVHKNFGKSEWKTMTLKEIMNKGIFRTTPPSKDGRARRTFNFSVPVSGAVEFNKKHTKVHPYVMGVMLGDGCSTENRLALSSNDEFVVAKVAKLIGADRYKQRSNSYTWYFSKDDGTYLYTKDIIGTSEEVAVKCHKKSIPYEYKYSSVNDRIELLRGLMDTDGYIPEEGGYYAPSYSTTSYELAKDLQFLVRSLGWSATISLDRRKGKRDCYNILLNIPHRDKVKIFTLPRRLDRAKEAVKIIQRKKYDKISIVGAVKLDKQEEMVCIMVDNSEHLYLTNDFIVTHNTSTIKGFLNSVLASGYRISLTCFSGKAADNLSQVTGHEGMTIHRLLGAGQGENGGFAFGDKLKLHTNAVVLDELSMVNARIFLALLKAIPSGAKLIMLGDFGQLEAIGVGVMAGIIRSKVFPMTLLKKVNRQAQDSAIVTHSISVRGGHVPEGLKMNTNEPEIHGAKQDLKYIFVNNAREDMIFDKTIEEFKVAIEKYPIEDIQILCSTKTSGKVSTYELNQTAQKIYNPYKTGDDQIKLGFSDSLYYLRVGDKVINMKNNRVEDTNGENARIYNGNTGVVLSITGNTAKIRFDGIGDIVVGGDALNYIQLGYAITIHKSQGSTIKCVITAIPFHFLLNTRELAYTGMTRASDYQVIISSPRSFKRALEKTDVRSKQIMLHEFIINKFGNKQEEAA